MSSPHDFSAVDVLAKYGRDLRADPRATGDKTFGRQAEVEALARAIASGKSAVLVGPPGVGKTAIVHKLLHYLREKRLPQLQEAKVYELSTVGLTADTSYVGELESKIKALLQRSKGARPVVYMPDLWNLPTTGSYTGNPRGAYDLLRPAVEEQRLVLVGEMTRGRWDRLCREHPTFAVDFNAIEVKETDDETTREILRRAAADLTALARFDSAAVDRAHALTRKFVPAQSFPGKGVDLLRRVAQAARPPTATGEAPGSPIDPAFVEEVFGRQSGLPLHMISSRVRVSYDEMREFLAERVLGQREAVDAVADLLALFKTGLKNPDRPAGVLLFVGPTGVGKTELAKATAEFLFGRKDRMFRVDLSEYKDYHSFEKLIGDPKTNQPGLLTNHVRANPFTVILLDEFEKGHSNIADLFLQVFDDGRLTDGSGDTVDLRNAIIILTSNIGSDLASEAAAGIGFGGGSRESPRALEGRIRRALEGAYRPEFLNRIDRVLVFHALTESDMRRIAQRELGLVYRREGLLERDLLLEVDDGVIDLLLERGFDPKYGARPLKRAIEEIIVLPLARTLLAVDPGRFQLLRIARRGDGVALSIEDTDSSRKLKNLEVRTRVAVEGGRVVRLSLAEVTARLREVASRLAAIETNGQIAKRRAELLALDEAAARPGYWEQAFGKEGELFRRHRLAVEVRRFDDLRGRAELVRELVEASFAEAEDAVAADLVAEFVKLDDEVRRAEREIVRFTGADQADARLRLRPIGGKAGALDWARDLARMYAAWAREHGLEVTTEERDGEVELRVEGPYAFGYLKGEAGGHRLIRPPSPPAKDRSGRDRAERSRDGAEKRGDTFLCRVEVEPLAADHADAAHKAAAGPDDEAPIRTYDLLRSRGVHDRRTGHTDGDVKRVLAGRIEAFVEAYLDAPA